MGYHIDIKNKVFLIYITFLEKTDTLNIYILKRKNKGVNQSNIQTSSPPGSLP